MTKTNYLLCRGDNCPLRMTWQDIKRIVEIADHLCPYTSKEMAEFQENFQTEEAYYREVLKQFNDGGKD